VEVAIVSCQLQRTTNVNMLRITAMLEMYVLVHFHLMQNGNGIRLTMLTLIVFSSRTLNTGTPLKMSDFGIMRMQTLYKLLHNLNQLGDIFASLTGNVLK